MLPREGMNLFLHENKERGYIFNFEFKFSFSNNRLIVTQEDPDMDVFVLLMVIIQLLKTLRHTVTTTLIACTMI
jgi:hypothetical protein